MINPFIYATPIQPSHFVGRKQEIKRVFERLVSPPYGSISITGERRIGKTSLLHYLLDLLERAKPEERHSGYFVLRLDCQPIELFTFWHEVFNQLTHKIGESEVKAIEPFQGAKPVNYNEIKTVLAEFESQHRRRLVLLLDEFEGLVKTRTEEEIGATRNLLYTLRALINDPRPFLSIVTTTCETLRKTCRSIPFDGPPFYNVLTHIRLHPFVENEAWELIDRALAETEIVFTERDRAFVYRVSKGHPNWLQYTCFKLFEEKLGAVTGAVVDEYSCYRKIEQQLEEERANCEVFEEAQARLSQVSFRADESIRKLQAVSPGRKDARLYEECVFEILCFLFESELTEPELQSETGDRVQIRDIIFFNDSTHRFWTMIRQEHEARNVVFELKNTKSINNRHIDQLAGYLTSTLGRFGVLVTRAEPPPSIIKKAKLLYDSDRKVILFLSDSDLIAMIEDKVSQNKDPTNILRKKYVQFTRYTQ